MTESLLYWLSAEYKRQQPRLAKDAADWEYNPDPSKKSPSQSIKESITSRFNAEEKRWAKSNREAAERFGSRFSDQSRAETIKAINENLKAAGLASRVKGSRTAQAISGLQREQTIDRIENILQTHLKGVMGTAMHDFIQGEDVRKFKAHVRRQLERAERKAANEMRSLANEMTQKYAQTSYEDLSLHTCIWIHIPGKKYSRRTHEEFNGQEYDDRVGLYDREVQRRVKPGELRGCQCSARVKIPDWLR